MTFGMGNLGCLIDDAICQIKGKISPEELASYCCITTRRAKALLEGKAKNITFGEYAQIQSLVRKVNGENGEGTKGEKRAK